MAPSSTPTQHPTTTPSASPTISAAPSHAPTSNKDIAFKSRSGWFSVGEDDEHNGKSGKSPMMKFWAIIAGAIGFALCVVGALCYISRGKSEDEEYYDEDIEEYYEGNGARRGSSYGRQRHQSARAMYYEDGDDNLVPPDYLFVERGHHEHRMIRDRQAEIDLMNRLYSNQRPNDWL